jgi:hypothetical protein
MMLVISFAVAGAIMGGSGLSDAIGVDKATGLQDDADQLREKTDRFSADRGSSSSSFLGFTASAVGAIVGMLKWSLMLPAVLINIGFPEWFAFPIAIPIQLVNYVGVYQIIRGMNIV